MDLSPVIISIPVFFVLIAIELIYEHWRGHKTYRLNDAITNINLGTLDQVSGLFFKVVKIGIYTLVFESFAVFSIAPSALSFVFLFILYDLCYYWSHRMAHEISLFWGGHVVHHQSEDYNLSVALRQSSTSFIWSMPFYLPLAIIGFSPVQLIFVAGLNLLYQFWIHTEHIKKLPSWFEAIMNTPSHHRVHHARNPKYIDHNYAGVFITWDRLFGTFVEEDEKPRYGITKPLASWNPVYANFAHYIDLFRAVGRSHQFSDSLSILFKKPGWMPEYLGGYQKPQEINLRISKYNANPSKAKLNIYLSAQFVLLLLVTAYFLFNTASFSLGMKSSLAGWIIVSTLVIGLVFDNSDKKWLFWAEYFRLISLILGLVWIYSSGGDISAMFFLFTGIIIISSIIYFSIILFSR